MIIIHDPVREHPFSMYAKFSGNRACVYQGPEMLVFRKILLRYRMGNALELIFLVLGFISSRFSKPWFFTYSALNKLC